MKCPFLVRRKDIFDKEGKKIGEDIDIQDCIKNECMVYDSAIKLCSLLSSNMKTGILIEDFKNGMKEIKEEMFQRAESTGIVIATTIQTLQDALLGRFDILKKQNEVIALGFDRMSELENSIFQIIKESSDKVIGNIGTLKDTFDNQGNSMKAAIGSLQNTAGQIAQVQVTFSAEIKNIFGEYQKQFEKANQEVLAKTGLLKNDLEKLTATSQSGMEAVSSNIDKAAQTTRDILKKMDLLDNLVAGTNNLSELMKNEISGIKTEGLSAISAMALKFDELGKNFTEGLSALGNLKTELAKYFDSLRTDVTNFNQDTKTVLSGMQVGFGRFEEMVGQMGAGLGSINNAIGEMNHNYLESLSKIAGLADAMRQGVEKVGDRITFKFDEIGQAIRAEIASARSEATAPVADIKDGMTKLAQSFSESRTSLADMSTMMNNLNHNYLESLSKIAGLAEGMRKGVEKVGEGMHESVKDLVSEMKKEIGALEKQYETTFKDIARLAEKFSELSSRLDKMTQEVQRDFKESFDRQNKLSDFTKDILKNIKDYFDKEDARYKDEQVMQRKKEAIDHFDRGTLYFYRGNYELSLNEIDKALDVDKTAEYMNLKGLVLTELGRQDEARKIFQEALKLEPNMSEIYNNLGLLYLKMKKLDAAIAAFEDAIKRNVNYALAYVHLGKAFVELEKYDEAMKVFDHALQIDPGNREAKEAVAMYKEGKVG